jgi:hypothetical protein
MKQLIKNSLKGLVLVPVLALAFSFVAGLDATPAFAQGCSVTGGLEEGVTCARPSGNAGQASLFDEGGIFQTVANILLFLVGAIAVIMLIVGGIRYVVSGGDQSAVTGAKNTILYAVVGIVVAFLAFAAVDFVITQLNGA